MHENTVYSSCILHLIRIDRKYLMKPAYQSITQLYLVKCQAFAYWLCILLQNNRVFLHLNTLANRTKMHDPIVSTCLVNAFDNAYILEADIV